MKTIIKNTLILVAITLIAGLALATVYEITKDPIENAKEKAEIEAYQKVMDAEKFSDPVKLVEGATVNECVVGMTADGDTIGYVVNVTSPNGYGGDVTLAVGILVDGSISGVSVISNGETPGLGKKCEKDNFTDQFKGITGFVEYVKGKKTESNQIQAITSATITTNAVTEAVNDAIAYVQENFLAEGGN